MASERSATALSDDEPCGLDLDLEEDGGYFQFTSSTDALLPDTYMQEAEGGKRVPFYLSGRYEGLDIGILLKSGSKLLDRTHDLRLLAIMAKLYVLNRNLPLFVATVADMAGLLGAFPSEVHPHEPEARAGALERLNEPLIHSALNNAVLFKSRRFGGVTWTSYLAATRDGGAGGTEGVERILREEAKGDPAPLKESLEQFGTLSGALATLITASGDISPASVPDLQKLIDQVLTIRDMMERASGVAAPPAAPGAPPDAARLEKGIPSTPIAPALPLLPDAAAAEAALAEAEHFFATVEPSSPSLLLLRQASALAGKSFFEALQTLMPDSADKAMFSFGPTLAVDLPLSRVAAARQDPSSDADDREGQRKSARPQTKVTSRTEALALLDQVSAFYRFVEPSSPIPLLVERARDLSGRDFAYLLREMVPAKQADTSW